MKKTVRKILESMTIAERTYLIMRLLFMLVSYRLRHIRPRARTHWLGRANRPRRPERVFIAFVLFGGFFALDVDQLLLWVSAWGGLVSLFVIARAFAMVVNR